jgi:Asp-tRNA(Asn)/Glu-tRNA(Gln) amidotransferase A subunit family amidase
MVPAGLGTQVVGSILRPSSFCGAVGFKPSVGAINRSGSHDHFSQSCQGAIGATLADTWAVLRAIADRAGGDPGFVGLSGDVSFARRAKPARLGVLETGGWGATTEGARKAFAAAREKLAKTGVELKSRADDPDIEAVEKAIADAQALTLAINAWEGPLAAQHLRRSRRQQAQRRRPRPVEDAEATTQKQYSELLARRVAAREAYAKVAGRYDAFVTLGACGAAPIGLGSTGNTAMNVAASLLGCPALTLPLLHGRGPAARDCNCSAHRPRCRAIRGGELGVRDAFDRADLVGAAG